MSERQESDKKILTSDARQSIDFGILKKLRNGWNTRLAEKVSLEKEKAS